MPISTPDAEKESAEASTVGSMNRNGELAEIGWLVEVILTAERQDDRRFFAVAESQISEAEEAILRYPGIFAGDTRIARRRLSHEEIERIGLRKHGVRPYILARQYA